MPARCSALGIVKSKKWVKGLDIMFYGRESISLRVARQAEALARFLAGEEPWHLPDVSCFLCPSQAYLACCCASRIPRRKTARVAGAVPTVLTTPRIIRTQRTF